MEEILENIKKTVKNAGLAVMEHYNQAQPIDVRYKDKEQKYSPVTDADISSEKILLEGLSKYNYGLLSEETEDTIKRLSEERVWVIDPLDGTVDFILKTGEFSIIVALVEDHQPIIGVVYQPTVKKLYYAVRGEGAFVEDESGVVAKLSVSRTSELTQMKMFVSRNHLLPAEIRFSDKHKVERIPSGSAGLKMCFIAEGKGEIYINSSGKTSEWDICAGDLIVQEAGGMVTDLNGKRIQYNREDPQNKDGFLVSNNTHHLEIIEKVNN